MHAVESGQGLPGRQVLWSATLGGAPLPDRVEAAIANGYAGLTVRPGDLVQLRAEGRDIGDVCRRMRDGGLHNLVLEALSEWYDHEPAPAWFTSASFTVDDHLAAAEAFGCSHLNIVAPFRSREDVDALTERFAVACDRFDEVGVAVHLEFTPFVPIPSLAMAWDIVRGADRPNGGLLIDAWHFFHGSPDLELLASVPGDRVFSVQLGDGTPTYVESLVKDTFSHRLLPGEGTFDLERFVRVLHETGGLNLAGPEVLSTALDALPPVEAARRAGEATDRVLSAALAGQTPQR